MVVGDGNGFRSGAAAVPAWRARTSARPRGATPTKPARSIRPP